ncbi:hypothetical protein [Xenorhabdus stockiae]|uniref:hypothetical protein n=1 Tax=Xenorhabdus stockiae TaxID=351614 RepID=UPI0040631DF9
MLDYNEEISFTHYNEEASFNSPCYNCTDSLARMLASNASITANSAQRVSGRALEQASFAEQNAGNLIKRIEALEKKTQG